MKKNVLELSRELISNVKKESERKVVLDILGGTNFLGLAEKYEEYTKAEIEIIFRKWIREAQKKNGLDEADSIEMKEWKNLVKKL